MAPIHRRTAPRTSPAHALHKFSGIRAVHRALGDTIVEVIMKNISNKKMISVMEAILNVADMRVLRFSAIAVSL